MIPKTENPQEAKKCLSGFTCAACLGWSGSIFYDESTMLVFSLSWFGEYTTPTSYLNILFIMIILNYTSWYYISLQSRENQHCGLCMLLYTSISLGRNVSARFSLRGLRRLILVDALRRVHSVCFLVEWLNFSVYLTWESSINVLISLSFSTISSTLVPAW